MPTSSQRTRQRYLIHAAYSTLPEETPERIPQTTAEDHWLDHGEDGTIYIMGAKLHVGVYRTLSHYFFQSSGDRNLFGFLLRLRLWELHRQDTIIHFRLDVFRLTISYFDHVLPVDCKMVLTFVPGGRGNVRENFPYLLSCTAKFSSAGTSDGEH